MQTLSDSLLHLLLESMSDVCMYSLTYRREDLVTDLRIDYAGTYYDETVFGKLIGLRLAYADQP